MLSTFNKTQHHDRKPYHHLFSPLSSTSSPCAATICCRLESHTHRVVMRRWRISWRDTLYWSADWGSGSPASWSWEWCSPVLSSSWLNEARRRWWGGEGWRCVSTTGLLPLSHTRCPIIRMHSSSKTSMQMTRRETKLYESATNYVFFSWRHWHHHHLSSILLKACKRHLCLGFRCCFCSFLCHLPFDDQCAMCARWLSKLCRYRA